MKVESRTSAFVIAVLASCLWGMSGTVAQILFQRYSFPPLGLITLRLTIASAFLLLWFRPKWPKQDSKRMLLFGIAGILPSQLFYFLAISYSNAAVATLLQILFLPIVVVYEVLVHVYRFTFRHFAAIALAMVGTFLLVVNGMTLGLHITLLSFVFGIACAFGAAYYTLAARALTRRWGSWTTTTWGFVIAGLLSAPLGTESLLKTRFSVTIALLVIFVALIGTLLTYGLYVMSLRRLTGTEASVAATGEPITASIASYVVLGTALSTFQYLGGGLIIVAIVLLRSVIRGRSESTERKSV